MTDEPRRPPFAYDMQRRTDGHVVWWESVDQRWVVVSADYWHALHVGGDDLLTEEASDLGGMAPAVTEEVTNPMARMPGRREAFSAASIVPADGSPVTLQDDDFAYRNRNQVHLGTALLLALAFALVGVGGGIWYGGTQANPYLPAPGATVAGAVPPPEPADPPSPVGGDAGSETVSERADAGPDDTPAASDSDETPRVPSPDASTDAPSTDAAPAKPPTAEAKPVDDGAPAKPPATVSSSGAPSGGTSGANAAAARGWSLVESAPAGAASAFREALSLNPNNLDAVYGLGYALLKLDKVDEAQPHLCRALAIRDVETRREASSMITRYGLSCD